MGEIIRISNLSKSFKNINAVNNLSFTVNEGDVYGFLGQNGAGKSTTMRMMLTLIKPTEGEIFIFNKNLNNSRHDILKNIGAIIEKPDLYRYLSAYDNLSIFARLSGRKVSRKLIMDQLQAVGLYERSNSKVKTFSQGMKQRLGIAVALVHNPRLIILDEPTNGLDPQGIADMRNLVKQLSSQWGKTVVISSHLLSEIELVANRMLIIHKGKKIAEGNVAEMLAPENTIVQLETTNNENAINILQQAGWGSALTQNAQYIFIKMNKKEIPQLVSQLTEKGSDVLSIQNRHSLEDYFLSLTNAESNVEPFTN